MSLEFPHRRDPRYMQIVILCTYAVVAREFFHFERSHWVTLSCVLWAVVLDLLLGRFYFKKVIFPLSAVIVALACSLLIDARTIYPYLLAVTLGILSKALITYKGRHLHNPANFAVVLILVLAPHLATGMATLFSGLVTAPLIFFGLGVITVIYARQHVISFSWVLGFIFFALVRATIGHFRLGYALNFTNIGYTIAPALGTSFLLFSFHMISDPATTPKIRKHKIIYAVTVAFVDGIMRFSRIPYGTFYALFIVNSFNPWIIDREREIAGLGQPETKRQVSLEPIEV